MRYNANSEYKHNKDGSLTRTRVNLTIDPQIYNEFKKTASSKLQPLSWILEGYMKQYINDNR